VAVSEEPAIVLAAVSVVWSRGQFGLMTPAGLNQNIVVFMFCFVYVVQSACVHFCGGTCNHLETW
jgi:hypothetical protein